MPPPPARNIAVQLMGPTATGKTELALDLVAEFPMEIISVDSALVYRGMDIGTAKPAAEILRAVPHHLVNICDPAERYSAGAFCRDALAAMADIRGRGKIPLLVGGTLLYFRALSEGLAQLPPADPDIRAALDAEAARIGWPGMHARLAVVDKAAAERIHPNDAQRIQRALEVFEQTGRPLSLAQKQTASADYRNESERNEFIRFGLIPDDRSKLKDRIEKRLNTMIERGFVDEVEGLFRREDLNAQTPALRAVGYRQVWQHLAGEYDLDEAVRKAVVATRRLAKRQMTWLRSEQIDVIIDPFAENRGTKVLDFVAARIGQAPETL